MKIITLAILAILIIFMVMDFSYQFNNTVKLIVYLPLLIIGIGIYLYNSDVNITKKKTEDSEE